MLPAAERLEEAGKQQRVVDGRGVRLVEPSTKPAGAGAAAADARVAFGDEDGELECVAEVGAAELVGGYLGYDEVPRPVALGPAF